MAKQKLILLNGFAGSGKSTIGRRYIRDNPLALLLEGDEIIVNLGQWTMHEVAARKIIFELTKSMARTHLLLGHDVVLPYLVVNASHIQEIEQIAADTGSDYYEFLLHNDKDKAIAQLLKRGTWGEADLEPLKDTDLPTIIELYEKMESQLIHRPNMMTIKQESKSVEDTYNEVMSELNKV